VAPLDEHRHGLSGEAPQHPGGEMTDLTSEELDRLLDPAALTEGGIKN
jgi:hypothetical protein